MVSANPAKSLQNVRKNEKVKRITTPKEIEELKQLREIGKTMELKEKMDKVNKEEKKEIGKTERKKYVTVNGTKYLADDPYGLSEAWWKIFTKPEVK